MELKGTREQKKQRLVDLVNVIEEGTKIVKMFFVTHL